MCPQPCCHTPLKSIISCHFLPCFRLQTSCNHPLQYLSFLPSFFLHMPFLPSFCLPAFFVLPFLACFLPTYLPTYLFVYALPSLLPFFQVCTTYGGLPAPVTLQNHGVKTEVVFLHEFYTEREFVSRIRTVEARSNLIILCDQTHKLYRPRYFCLFDIVRHHPYNMTSCCWG